jgi:site-specific recombinase
VLVMLLHWTVATKQPAMTAPALAASLPAGRNASDAEIEAFVDRVAQLIRSQAAGIAGNLAVCGPLVLAVQCAGHLGISVRPWSARRTPSTCCTA